MPTLRVLRMLTNRSGCKTTIAEVKTISPFGFSSTMDFYSLLAMALKGGDLVAIHTDARWGGSFDLLESVRGLTKKLIVAKGIHATDEEVSEAVKRGADFVLVVGRVPGVHASQCLIEPRSIAELQTLQKHQMAVWNARDLETGEPKTESWQDARAAFSGWLCQASYIQKPEDVHPDADAILVGTHLPDFLTRRREGTNQ